MKFDMDGSKGHWHPNQLTCPLDERPRTDMFAAPECAHALGIGGLPST